MAERLRHGVRTAVGCLVGYVLSIWLNLRGGQWVLITVALVMLSEPRTGGLWRKSVQRFWGTVLGAGVALAILLALPGRPPWDLLWALPALVGFGYLAADAERSYVGVLGAVTLVMVVMEPDRNLEFAAKRIAQIVLGLVVAVGTGMLVLPDHARVRLRRSVSEYLLGLSAMAAHPEDRDAIEPRLVKALGEQRKLVGEALAEGEKAGRSLLEELLLAERRAFRYLFLLSQVPDERGFLMQVAAGLQALYDRNARPSWPEEEFSSDPVHRMAGERLLEACRSLEDCVQRLEGV